MTDIDYFKHCCGSLTNSFLDEVLAEAKAMRAREFIEMQIEDIGVHLRHIIAIIEEIKEERKIK